MGLNCTVHAILHPQKYAKTKTGVREREREIYLLSFVENKERNVCAVLAS